MKFKGKVTDYQEKKGTSKKGEGYIVRQWRLEETEGQYPNSLLVEAFNKSFDNCGIGAIVEADLNTKCEEYNGKYYNKISVWRMSVEVGAEMGVEGVLPNATDGIIPGGYAYNLINGGGTSAADGEKPDDLPF